MTEEEGIATMEGVDEAQLVQVVAGATDQQLEELSLVSRQVARDAEVTSTPTMSITPRPRIQGGRTGFRVSARPSPARAPRFR